MKKGRRNNIILLSIVSFMILWSASGIIMSDRDEPQTKANQPKTMSPSDESIAHAARFKKRLEQEERWRKEGRFNPKPNPPLENKIIKPDRSQAKRLYEESQAERLDMINRLIREGIFDRIEVPGTLPRLWVGPTFTNLDFKTKNSFVGVVYAYYFDKPGYKPGLKQSKTWKDTVRIYDMYTGKEIGSYNLGNWGAPLKLK